MECGKLWTMGSFWLEISIKILLFNRDMITGTVFYIVFLWFLQMGVTSRTEFPGLARGKILRHSRHSWPPLVEVIVAAVIVGVEALQFDMVKTCYNWLVVWNIFYFPIYWE